ncbi:MAG: iron-containing alcohol dehydrogenase [Candidatus Hydrogenedentes bacterium]|nr:iron-containing alcohol dehydrogenase [Candidatus Hydrogenedentota bacterium]
MSTKTKRGELLARAYAVSPDLAIEICHIGSDAAKQLADFAKAKCGVKAFVVSDENTRKAVGDAPYSELRAAGKSLSEKVFGGERLDASDHLGDEVAEEGRDADFFVGIGSGSVCDLAKHAGTKLNRPVLLYGTAASMNGYTSGITAMKVRGLKRTIPCQPALGVFADPAVVAAAPARMTAAGVADFLSKCSAGADWRTAHFLRNEYYDESALRFYEGIVEEMLESAEAVGRGDANAAALVMEALLLSGLAMLVAGSSSPASGGEHLISHFVDMKQALYGTPNDLHGVQVGVATVHCLRLWEKVLAVDASAMDIDALVDSQPTEAQIRTWAIEDWGESVAAEVLKQWGQKALDPAGIRAELEKFRDGLPELRKAVGQDLLPAETVASAIRLSGGPTEPEGMTAPLDEYRKALKRARYIRNRFTVLDLSAELGLD